MHRDADAGGKPKVHSNEEEGRPHKTTLGKGINAILESLVCNENNLCSVGDDQVPCPPPITSFASSMEGEAAQEDLSTRFLHAQ